MTRNEVLKKLEGLLDLIGQDRPRDMFRGFIDLYAGEWKYGGKVNPWAEVTNTVRGNMPKSKGVQKLVEGGNLTNMQIQRLVTAEHQTPISVLDALFRQGRFEEVLDLYSVVFVTREEDAALREASKTGVKGIERYNAAGVEF